MNHEQIEKMIDIENNDSGNDLEEVLNYSFTFKKEFLKKRSIFFWGTVHDESAKNAIDQLFYLESLKSGEPITLYINSPGGVVTSGMVVYDTMQMISSPVHTVCMGLAASMGSILLSGGTKGKRSIYPSGRVMIHQPSIGRLFGQASDIQISAREIIKTKEMSAKLLADNCGKTFEQIMKDFDRDYWMNAKESLEYGIVDNIVEKLSF